MSMEGFQGIKLLMYAGNLLSLGSTPKNSAQLCGALVLMQNCHLSPDDHSRVHLTPVEGVPDSDYINASFINVSACPA